ncbi:hypothetical protein CR983_02440 [Candidatus Saccharibacteria bacterium]|nr:MAG: hypothetical protein CR983_02440 [Candidatus Saccharibacteria bacterium]
MSRLLVAPSYHATHQQLQCTLPPAIILDGSRGMGLGNLARVYAGQECIIVEPTDTKGREDQHGTIAVDAIRALYERTRSIANKRVVIIHNADRMSHSAQNALLKLLEEPPTGTHFILTTHDIEALLPTIRSRALRYSVPPISEHQSRQLLASANLDDTTIKQLLYIAGGRPAQLASLAHDKTARNAAITLAEQASAFLGTTSRYQRLCIGLDACKDRSSARAFIDMALTLASHGLRHRPDTASSDIAERLLELYDEVSHNANIRLSLARFVLQ